MLVAHLALAFALKLFFPDFSLFFMLVGTSLSGLDALVPILGLRDDSYHCGSVFHSVWLPVVGALFLQVFDAVSSISFLVGGLLHVVSDSTDTRGRPWLCPLSKRVFGIRIFPYDFKAYVTNPVCLAVETASVAFVLVYVYVVGVDLLSILWLALLLPLFAAFALHQWRLRGDEEIPSQLRCEEGCIVRVERSFIISNLP